MKLRSLVTIGICGSVLGLARNGEAQTCSNNGAGSGSGESCTYGVNTYAGTNNSFGVFGEDDNAPGVAVYGTSSGSIGVQGVSQHGYGVIGLVQATSGTGGVGVTGGGGMVGAGGVQGTASHGFGVEGISTSGVGVSGFSSSSIGLLGVNNGGTSTATPAETAGVVGSGSGTAIYGGFFTSNGADGAHGESTEPGSSGVAGIGSGAGANGVYGSGSGSGYGVYGVANSSSVAAGVFGYNGASSSTSYGVWGVTNSATGFAVYANGGSSPQGTAVFGDNRHETSGGNAAVNGQTGDANGYGGYFVNQSSGSGSGYALYAGSSVGGGTAIYASGAAEGVGVEAVVTEGGWAVYGSASGGTAGTGGATGTYAGNFIGNVRVTGTLYCGSGCSSDERLKKSIEPLHGALDQMLKLKGVTFEWKDPAGRHTGTQTGVIAQQVKSVFPQWIGEDDKGFMTVDPDARTMVGLTVESFREQQVEIDALKKQNKTLREHSASADDRLDRLEGLTNLPQAGVGYGYGGWGVAGVLGVALSAVLADRSKNKKS